MVGAEAALEDPGNASAWQGDTIARETGSSRNTVRRYLRDERRRHGGLK
jgi:predicted transcriptional regulator